MLRVFAFWGLGFTFCGWGLGTMYLVLRWSFYVKHPIPVKGFGILVFVSLWGQGASVSGFKVVGIGASGY